MKEYKLEIEAKRIKGEKDGRKYDFLAYSGFTNDGKKCKFKFTKDCKLKPEEEGLFICTVDSDKIWQNKQTKFREYFISELKSCEVFVYTTPENDDLPF